MSAWGYRQATPIQGSPGASRQVKEWKEVNRFETLLETRLSDFFDHKACRTSPTRDQTYVPSIASTETQTVKSQGKSLLLSFLKCINLNSFSLSQLENE